MEQDPGNKHFTQGLADASKGEMAEKEVYELLKDYYGKKTGAALIVHNDILVHPDATKKEITQQGTGKQETDFLIVDKDSHALINIEVKSFLGKWHDQPEKDWPTTKVKKANV